MKKKIVATTLILLSLSLVAAKCRKSDNLSQAPAPDQEKSYTVNSIKAAIDLGIPLKCNYSVNGVEYEGYLKGKNYRGKLTLQDGQVGDIIVKDNCIWTWSDQMPSGLKMCVDDMWENEDNSQYAPPDIEYHCRAAVITDDKFTPPADQEFMSLEEMMQGQF